MLTTICALCVGLAAKDPESMRLISALPKKYADTVSLKGVVIGATSDGVGTVKSVTEFSLQRPAFVSLKQTLYSNSGGTYTVLSDGRIMTYEEPITVKLRTGQRLAEPIRKQNGYMMNVTDVYVAGSNSIPDPNVGLDLVFGSKERFEGWKKRILTASAPVKTEFKGEEVYKITGQLAGRAFQVSTGELAKPAKPQHNRDVVQTADDTAYVIGPAGSLQLFIGMDGMLRRLIEVDTVGTSDKSPKIAIVNDVTVEVNPDIPQSLFAVKS